MSLSRRLTLRVSAVVCASALLWASHRAVGNLWLMLNDLGSYRVPARSSIFTFDPTVLNEGSGGWWIYGEDLSSYYWFADGAPSGPLSIRKSVAARCAGFVPTDHTTWCEKNADLTR